MTDDHIRYNKKGEAVSFVGEDAVHVFRAAALAGSLRLWAKTGMIPTRGVSGRMMLDLASQYTKRKYKRTEGEQAAADLDIFVKTMKAALPIKED